MKLLKNAAAGTLESSDCRVCVSPADGVILEYNGANSVIFADRTKKLVDEVLKENDLSGAKITIQDQGAIEITIRARLECALERAAEE